MVKRVLFVGSKPLGLRILKLMHGIAPGQLCGVVTLDDQNDRRSVFSELADYCAKSKLIFEVARNRSHFGEVVMRHKPDLAIVVGWYWLIGEGLLQSLPSGFIGIHNSLLPQFRGGSPLVWTMISGQPRAGYSLFSLSAGVDDGPVWHQGSVEIAPDDTIGDVMQRLECLTVQDFEKLYPRILSEQVKPGPQSSEGATYCAQRIPEDGLIDWRWSASRIHDFIRAQSDPYPGAFTWMNGQRLTIWRSCLDQARYYGTPGQVARIMENEVLVIGGDYRAVVIKEAEADGRRTAAARLIRSHQTRLAQ